MKIYLIIIIIVFVVSIGIFTYSSLQLIPFQDPPIALQEQYIQNIKFYTSISNISFWASIFSFLTICGIVAVKAFQYIIKLF
jgi:hypothetical protein